MKRHIPGLHGDSRNTADASWRAFSWSASIGSSTAGIPSGRSTFCGSSFSNQENIKAVPSTVGSTALPKRSGNSAGSCGTLAMTPI